MDKRTVYTVVRHTKTTKSTRVGDYGNAEEAKTAMVEHYKTTPKRGDFYYCISQEDLEDIGGVTFRKITLVLNNDGSRNYFARFDRDKLKQMIGEKA